MSGHEEDLAQMQAMWKQVSYQTDIAFPMINKAMDVTREVASKLGVDGTMQHDGNFDWLNVIGFHAIDTMGATGEINGGVAQLAVGLHNLLKNVKEVGTCGLYFIHIIRYNLEPRFLMLIFN